MTVRVRIRWQAPRGRAPVVRYLEHSRHGGVYEAGFRGDRFAPDVAAQLAARFAGEVVP